MSANPFAVLTTRQRAVLMRLTFGESDYQIARALGVKPLTVRNHLTRIYARLGVRSRTQAAVYAIVGVAPPWEFVVVDSAEKIV